MILIDDAVKKFESCSGALLSRNFKCKIMGLVDGAKERCGQLPTFRLFKRLKYLVFSYSTPTEPHLNAIGTTDSGKFNSPYFLGQRES